MFLQPTHSECIRSSVRHSVCGWVRAKRGIWSKRVWIRKIGNFSFSVRWRNSTIIYYFLLAQKVLDIFEKPFDTIAASLSNILIWTSTCGSAPYKRNIQNRKIQSKRVLGLMKYTHRLADHNKVTQLGFFSRNVFSFWELFPATTKKLTQPHNCIVH